LFTEFINQMAHFVGSWSMGEVPEEFFDILKLLGYNGIQRKVMKNVKPIVHTEFKEDVLTVRLSSNLFKRSRDYKINGEILEYTDEWKNQVMEISKFRDEKTIETQTTYLEKNITVTDIREIVDDNTCRHYLLVMAPELDSPLEVNMVYNRTK